MTRKLGLQVAGELLLSAAVLVALLLVWLLWWTDRVAGSTAAHQVTSLQQRWAGETPVRQARPLTARPADGTPFAVLHVPRFGTHWRSPVVQGTGTADLRKGVGHYSGTALPGALGNLGVAGHRTTWGAPFARIADLRSGDPVVVETASGWFVYSVTGHEIVRPGSRQVLAPVPDHPGRQPGEAVLTLTSCHPKYSAARRYVVHGVLTSSRARAAGPPRIRGL